jgi:cysteine desulfurase
MGVDASLAKSAIRVSLGKTNTEGDINDFIKLLKNLVCQDNL